MVLRDPPPTIPMDPWPGVLSLPGWFVGDPTSLARDNITYTSDTLNRLLSVQAYGTNISWSTKTTEKKNYSLVSQSQTLSDLSGGRLDFVDLWLSPYHFPRLAWSMVFLGHSHSSCSIVLAIICRLLSWVHCVMTHIKTQSTTRALLAHHIYPAFMSQTRCFT